QVPGVIPPLRPKLGMVEVVPRKLERIPGQRLAILRLPEPEHRRHPQRENPTLHAAPRWAPDSRPREPGRSRTPPLPHTPTSARPAAPPPASGTESSTQTTAC